MDFLLQGLKETLRLVFTGDPVTWHAILVSLTCTSAAVLLAAVLAIPYGAWLGVYRPGWHRVEKFDRTATSCMALNTAWSEPTCQSSPTAAPKFILNPATRY